METPNALPLHPPLINARILRRSGYVVIRGGMIVGKGRSKKVAIAEAVRFLDEIDWYDPGDERYLKPIPATRNVMNNDHDDDFVKLEGGFVCSFSEEPRVKRVKEARRAEWDRWIKERADTWPLPAATQCALFQEALYREALVQMALAFANGSEAVSLDEVTGAPRWSEKAAIKPKGTLSMRPSKMCSEMVGNLGAQKWSWDAMRLIRLCQTTFGQEWHSVVANCLSVNVRTVQRWAAGEKTVPTKVIRDIATYATSLATQKEKEASAIHLSVRALAV